MKKTFRRMLYRCWEFFGPESYCKWRIRSLRESYEPKLVAALESKDTRKVEELESECQFFAEEFAGPRDALRDKKLIAQARKRGIEVFDVLVAEGESRYRMDNWGNQLLRPDVEEQLRQLMRKAEKDYRKERREIWDFRLRMASSLLSGTTGIVGTVIGLVALLKK